MPESVRRDKDGMVKHMRPVDYVTDAMGQIGLNAISNLAGQMTYFYTNKVGMAAATIGTVLLVARLFDAVTDLFMGKIVDNTNTKYGKARPWLRRMTIPVLLALVLLFTVPPNAGNLRYVYALLTNIFASAIVYTAIAVPYYTMMAYRTKSSEEKGKMGTYRAAVGYAVGVGLGIGLIPITEALGDDQRAWIILASALGVVAAVGLYVTFHFARENYHETSQLASKEASVSMVEGIRILLSNSYWVRITVLGVCMNVMYSMVLVASIYYAQCVVGDPGFYSTVNTVNLVPSIIGFVTMGWVIDRIGLTNTARLGAVIGIVGTAVRLANPDNSLFFLVGGAIMTYATIPLISVLPAMALNTAEVNMDKHGVRITGMTNASNSFVGKIGSGLGGSAIGWILAAGGFDAVAAGGEVTPGVIASVYTLNMYVPLVMFILMLLLLHKYDLDQRLPELIERNRRWETAEQAAPQAE